MPAFSCQILPSLSRTQLYAEGAALLCFQRRSWDVTPAHTSLLQGGDAPGGAALGRARAISSPRDAACEHAVFALLRQDVCHGYSKAELCLLFHSTGGEANVQSGEAIWLSHALGQWLPAPGRPCYSLIFTVRRCYSVKTLGCKATIFTQPDSSGWLGI